MAASFGDWDVAAGLVAWSPGVFALLGLEPVAEALPVAAWRARVHPDDGPVLDGLAAALDGDDPAWDGAYRLRHAGGAWLLVQERAFLVRQDRRAVRVVRVLGGPAADRGGPPESLLARLERNEGEFRTFVESIAQLAWTMTPDGWIDYYNRRWYDYTGTTFEAMQGWGWVQVHDPDDLPRMLRIWRRALATGQPWEDEFRLRRGDGAMRWHLSRAMPARDAAGRVTRWFGTNTDIHDQKLALEERTFLLAREQEARRQAEEASRAKDEFLAVVSHELRTPLNAILGWATLLRRGRLGDEQRREAIETIERSARHQGVLIEDLLDTSRILSDQLQIARSPVRVLEPVLAAIEAMRPLAEERDVVLELAQASPGAAVAGDRDRLQQVLTNLLSNAVKFSRPGGRVQVRVQRDAGSVLLDVADEGEGIEPGFLPHVFDSFRQADGSSTRRHGGLGLGLSIARRIVELHGGALRAASAGPGRGATFTIVLPQGDLSENAAPPAPAPRNEPVSLRGATVLAVDDDARTRQLLATLLLASGASVVTAGSVAEALEAVRTQPPDVVVSDLAMPEVDGYGLVARVRALADPALAGLPILALTAFASLQDRERALAAGFDAYLAKPVEPGVLSRTLAGLIRRRLLEAEGGPPVHSA